MAVPNFLKVFLLVGFLLVERTGAQLYGVLGGEITLTPTISGQPTDILWKHNGNKVVELHGKENVTYGSYRGRTVLHQNTRALTIKGLTEEDSGFYELEALINSKLQYSKHEVKVINAVAQPSVSCEVKQNGTTLLCSADLQPLTQFTWRSPDGPDRPGSELFIPESENQPSVYTCVVRNPVSEKTTEFNLKDCHTEEVSLVTLAVVLSIIFIVLLIVIIPLALRCHRQKGKKSTERKPDEEMQIGTHNHTESQDPTIEPLLEIQEGHVMEKIKIYEAKAKNESNSSASRQINFHNMSEAKGQETKPHLPSSMNTPPGKEENLESEPESSVGEEDNTTTGQSQTPKQSQSQSKVDQPDLGQPVLKPQNKSDPISEDPKEDSQSGVQIQEPNQADTEMCGGEDGQFRINPTHSNLHSIMDDSGDANQERDTVGSSINTSLEHLLPQLPPSETSETQPDLHNVDPTSTQPDQVQSSLLSSDNNDKESPLDKNVKNVVDKPPQKPKRREKEDLGITDKPTNKEELVPETCNPGQPQRSAVEDGQLAVGSEKSEVEGQEDKVSEDKNIIAPQTSSGSTPPDNNTHLTSDQEENLNTNKPQDSHGEEKDVDSKLAVRKEDNAGTSRETSMGHSLQEETIQPGQNDKQQTNDKIESVQEIPTTEQTLPMSPPNQQVPDQPNDKQENKQEPQTEESKVNTDTSPVTPKTTQKQQYQDCENNKSEQD
ncbi:hypothetical protein UPYG_G00308710 [Umbra pygmaea]|uniref:Ig-like domain-containing protein n=1 Tax=Umbra pygmaea TaxID=75934 RepID=A0ABD0WG54_UMBPY